MRSRRAYEFLKYVAFPGIRVPQRPLKRDRGGNSPVASMAREDAKGLAQGGDVGDREAV